MINIVSSEFYKILKSKIFLFISTLLLSMNIIAFSFTLYVQKSPTISLDKKSQMLITGISSYQGSFSGDIIIYIILIFVSCLITAEYTTGSIRQIACHGISRWKLIIGQYIAISLVTTLVLLIFGVLNLLSDTLLSQLGVFNIHKFIWMNIGIISMFLGFVGVGTFFSYLFKNGGISIAISILIVITSNYVVQFLTLLTKNDIFIKYSFVNMRRIIIDLNSKPEDVLKCSIVFLIIAMITILGSSLLFTRRDID